MIRSRKAGLSQRTLRGMKGIEQIFDPDVFDWDGYKIMLDISTDEALPFIGYLASSTAMKGAASDSQIFLPVLSVACARGPQSVIRLEHA